MQTFSTRSLDGAKLHTWEVESLLKIAEGISPRKWGIPPRFLDEWSWGEDHISEHLTPCLKADLSTPILVWNGDIIDGCHRVCLALSLGRTEIEAIDLSFRMPYPDHIELYQTKPDPVWSFGDMVKILKALRLAEYDYRHPLDGV